MTRKLLVFTILFVFLCSMSVVYAMSSVPPIHSIEITAESFAPGTYKVYKNDDLGFSFKYPKSWFISDLDSSKPSVMSIWLTNFDTYKIPAIPKEKQFEIICGAGQDYYEETNNTEDKEKRMFFVAEKEFGNGYGKIKGVVGEINIKGGKIYLIKVTRVDSGDKEYEVGMIYLVKKDYKYLVTFFPFKMSDRKSYMKILKSAEIY